MIKRTVYFGNPAYLGIKHAQLEVRLPRAEQGYDRADPLRRKPTVTTIPIEDIGVVVTDHPQITLTHALMAGLLNNNVALITCDAAHHPTGLMLPLSVHTLQSERFRHQIAASLPLKKQLWKQTVAAKIINQANLLKRKNKNADNMMYWAARIQSGDAQNHEARAAAFYWKVLFPKVLHFSRDRFGAPPNAVLNYGYAILRAVVARSLVGSGLLPTFGIHHRNKYNAYCLADDVMEPYRPFVDERVCSMVENGEDFTRLDTSVKKQLLELPAQEITIGGEKSPLMVGVQRTTASLAKAFEGKTRKIIYPEPV